MNISHALFRRCLNFLPHDLKRTEFANIYPKQYDRYQRLRHKNINGYSFKPFDDTRSIFIHIPKAAGTSICNALYGNLAGGHVNIREYKLVFSKQDFSNYFKFTFVRNPWDRLHSAFYFLKSGGMNKDDQKWARRHLANIESFEQFVLEWLSSESIYRYPHFSPQTDMITSFHRHRIELNFLGYFENLEDDFQAIKSIVNPTCQLEHANKTQSPHTHYLEAYTGAMIDKVAEIYRQDIDLLQYDFDNSGLNQQLNARDSRLSDAA